MVVADSNAKLIQTAIINLLKADSELTSEIQANMIGLRDEPTDLANYREMVYVKHLGTDRERLSSNRDWVMFRYEVGVVVYAGKRDVAGDKAKDYAERSEEVLRTNNTFQSTVFDSEIESGELETPYLENALAARKTFEVRGFLFLVSGSERIDYARVGGANMKIGGVIVA